MRLILHGAFRNRFVKSLRVLLRNCRVHGGILHGTKEARERCTFLTIAGKLAEPRETAERNRLLISELLTTYATYAEFIILQYDSVEN